MARAAKTPTITTVIIISNKVNPIRDLRSLTVCADGDLMPPSASLFSLPASSVAFSIGVNAFFVLIQNPFTEKPIKPILRGNFIHPQEKHNHAFTTYPSCLLINNMLCPSICGLATQVSNKLDTIEHTCWRTGPLSTHDTTRSVNCSSGRDTPSY